jgi:hypothetical protein
MDCSANESAAVVDLIDSADAAAIVIGYCMGSNSILLSANATG